MKLIPKVLYYDAASYSLLVHVRRWDYYLLYGQLCSAALLQCCQQTRETAMEETNHDSVDKIVAESSWSPPRSRSPDGLRQATPSP